MPDLLKLRGTDAEDLSVLSLCLQDAIVHGPDISWQQDKKRFAFTTQRLCHEDKKNGLMRVNCRFWIDGVTLVQHKIDVQQTSDMVLLAIVPQGADMLKLHFNDQKTIRLTAPGWRVYLEDFGVHWPAEPPPPHAV